MGSLSRTQRRKRLREKARAKEAEHFRAQEVKQRYASTPGVLSFSNKASEAPLVEVLPGRHRRNYDAHGNIIFGPRPCELDAQRRALAQTC